MKGIMMVEPEKILSVKAIEAFVESLYAKYKYCALYYFNDNSGSTFSNVSRDIVIAYGNNEEELHKYCEGMGFEPSQKIFDGGYYIIDNEKYDGGI